MIKNLLPALAIVVSISSAFSQVKVRNVTEVDVATIAYPNKTGNTISSMANDGTVFLKDGTSVHGKVTLFKKNDVLTKVKVKTEADKVEFEGAQVSSVKLDDKVYEGKHPNNYKNPEKNFQPGYIVLANGVKLNGKVAQIRDFSDYDFFIHYVYFLPEGSDVASYFKGGKVSEFGQEINGVMSIWDGYADGYLLRMVDGRFRLSRNPYSQTKNEFFTALKNHVADSLAKGTAQAAFAKSLQNGTNVNESIENANSAGSAVGEILGQIQINKKEYLIFETKMNTVTSVNKDSFREIAAGMINGCTGVVAPEWDKIEDFVRSLNKNCN